MTTETLYKLNNFNTIQWWTITLNDCHVLIEWGSKLPISSTNLRQVYDFETPQQATDFFYSTSKHQRDRKGYSVEVPTSPPDLPMKAHEYNPRFIFPRFAVQPKMDGIRCIASKDDMISRTNTSFSSCPSIALLLNYLPPEIKLDGELYIPNTPFSTIQSYILRRTPDKEVSKIIEYHIFDIIDTEAPFEERYAVIAHMISILEEAYLKIRLSTAHPLHSHPWFSPKFPFKLVPTNFFNYSSSSPEGQATIKSEFDAWKALNYEGAMIRDTESPYEVNKRSNYLLKYKAYIDSEFEIVDVEEGRNSCGIFVCETSSGTRFNVTPKFSSLKKQQILTYKQNYIGKWLKVEYDGLFETGKPRCPVGVWVYDTKDHA